MKSNIIILRNKTTIEAVGHIEKAIFSMCLFGQNKINVLALQNFDNFRETRISFADP
jgi:hypothetical protein